MKILATWKVLIWCTTVKQSQCQQKQMVVSVFVPHQQFSFKGICPSKAETEDVKLVRKHTLKHL